MTKKRTRMDKFSLNEISFVDRPAQTPAVAAIMKNADDEIKKSDLVSMFTESSAGHQHGMSIHADHDGLRFLVHYASIDGQEQGHDHQLMRMIDGSYMMSENQGHSHGINQEMIIASLMDIMTKHDGDQPICIGEVELADLPEIIKHQASDNTDQKEVSMTKAVEKTEAEVALDASTAENAVLKSVIALTPAHKAHYDSLDVTLEDDARTEFLGKTADERDAIVTKAVEAVTEADPVIYKSEDGSEYRKSDDPRLVKMAQDRDADRKDIIKNRVAAQDADLTKRAEGDLENFPGTVDVRKEILKAVDGITDETVRTAAHEALKAQNTKMASAFTVVGADGETVAKGDGSDNAQANAELDQLAKDEMTKSSVDFYTAYETVSEANPALLAKAVG